MGCIRNSLRTWVELVGLVVVIGLFIPVESWGAFASQFSLGAGEEYNDNIFFTKNKEHDFITIFAPAFSFLYAPSGEVEPTGRLRITPVGQIYGRHSELNNFGDNFSIDGGYLYRYSPRLTFTFSDTANRQGVTRTEGFVGGFAVPTLPTTGIDPFASHPQDLKDVISAGNQFSNWVSLQGSFLYRPDVSFTGGYSNSFVSFIGRGETDVFHTVGLRGVYNWRQDHNLHAGYFLSIANSRNGDNGIIHNFDLGDDYFGNYRLQLTPTLSLSASTGVSFNAGNSGPRVANNTNVTITKLWEKAYISGGVRKGLTPSFGVSGVSDTTSFFTDFTMLITEKLSATAKADFSLYNTKDVNFNTFQGGLALLYSINSWLSTGVDYRFNWIDSGVGAASTNLLEKGVVNSNSVFVVLTSRFDLWPNVGLAKSTAFSPAAPVLRTPFISPAVAVPNP